MKTNFIYIALIAILSLMLLSGCSQQQTQAPAGNTDASAKQPAPASTNTAPPKEQSIPNLPAEPVADENGPGEIAAPEEPEPDSSAGSTNHTILITAQGFEPSTLTIKHGDIVTWMNNDSPVARWPASASHPTHRVYPGSGIEKCGTSEQSDIFDACGNIVKGGSFSFIFNEKGSWGFHNHSNPTTFGKITVE